MTGQLASVLPSFTSTSSHVAAAGSRDPRSRSARPRSICAELYTGTTTDTVTGLVWRALGISPSSQLASGCSAHSGSVLRMRRTGVGTPGCKYFACPHRAAPATATPCLSSPYESASSVVPQRRRCGTFGGLWRHFSGDSIGFGAVPLSYFEFQRLGESDLPNRFTERWHTVGQARPAARRGGVLLSSRCGC